MAPGKKASRPSAEAKEPKLTPEMTALQTEEHDKHLAWANWLADWTDKDFSSLAKEAGRSSNLLTRMRTNGLATLDALSIRLLCHRWKVPGPETYLVPGNGFSPEGTVFDPESDPVIALMISATLERMPLAKAYRLNTRLLEHSGFAIGDIVLVDHRPFLAGSPVAAEVFSKSGTSRVIFRISEPPFLRTHGSEPHKDIHVDETVNILGPIVAQLRPRSIS